MVAMIALLLPSVSGCEKKQPEEKREVIRPVKTMVVHGKDSGSRFTLPGTVRAATRAVLSFKVSGPLVALPVEEGQHVKKGDLIAQIEKRDFKTALEQAVARNREAEQQFRRYKELYAKRQVSKADFDRYRAARDVSRAELEDARNALKDTSLRAPFDGVIAKRYVENHQKVQAKEPIVNLQDISEIEVLVNVPELMMAGFKSNNHCKITAGFDSIPGHLYPLSVKEYSTDADPATRTYQIVFTMKQPEEANILPGMTATVNVNFISDSQDSGKADIILPDVAVLDAPGNHPYVWILDSSTGMVHKREVQVGSLAGSGFIKIVKGLQPGDRVVISGVTKLREGMKVRQWENQEKGR
jgi:RND family efflux transporter MFP subunit